MTDSKQTVTRLGHREFMALPLRERLSLRHENRTNVYAWGEAIEAYEKDRADAAELIDDLLVSLQTIALHAPSLDAQGIRKIADTAIAQADPATNRVRYGKFTITYDPPPIPVRTMDFQFVHDDYDGAPDAGDNRSGHGSSIEDCKRQIDDLEGGES